jgi:hypothetical protein
MVVLDDVDELLEVDELEVVLEEELEVVEELVVMLVLEEVLDVDEEVLLVLDELLDAVVVVVVGGIGQPASLVGALVLFTILNTLFGVPVAGAMRSAPPAAPPKATQ